MNLALASLWIACLGAPPPPPDVPPAQPVADPVRVRRLLPGEPPNRSSDELGPIVGDGEFVGAMWDAYIQAVGPIWNIHYPRDSFTCDTPASAPTRSIPAATFHKTSWWKHTLVRDELILDRRAWGGDEPGPSVAWRHTPDLVRQNRGWWLIAPTLPDRWVAVAVDAPCGSAPVSWARQVSAPSTDRAPRQKDLVDLPAPLPDRPSYVFDGNHGLVLWLPPSTQVPGTWWVFVGTPASHPGPVRVAWLDPPEWAMRTGGDPEVLKALGGTP